MFTQSQPQTQSAALLQERIKSFAFGSDQTSSSSTPSAEFQLPISRQEEISENADAQASTATEAPSPIASETAATPSVTTSLDEEPEPTITPADSSKEAVATPSVTTSLNEEPETSITPADSSTEATLEERLYAAYIKEAYQESGEDPLARGWLYDVDNDGLKELMMIYGASDNSDFAVTDCYKIVDNNVELWFTVRSCLWDDENCLRIIELGIFQYDGIAYWGEYDRAMELGSDTDLEYTFKILTLDGTIDWDMIDFSKSDGTCNFLYNEHSGESDYGVVLEEYGTYIPYYHNASDPSYDYDSIKEKISEEMVIRYATDNGVGEWLSDMVNDLP
jgi:hypothetical protein